MGKESQLPKGYFEHLQEVEQIIGEREVIIFLDYDGTLTPIVATPDMAIISDAMREIVRSAAQKMRVSIVSGRATEDVRSKVKLDGIFYAGSHGFEIIDPDGGVTINDEAEQLRDVIDDVHTKLQDKLKKIDGVLVEHVKYTITTHYRLVSDEDVPKVEGAVDEVLKDYPLLRKTSGKKVFELRPKIDWDKGRAVNWILKHMNFNPDVSCPVYIGDDTTDEDAFRVILSKGIGILVADEPRESLAQYMIDDTVEVSKVIEDFIKKK